MNHGDHGDHGGKQLLEWNADNVPSRPFIHKKVSSVVSVVKAFDS